MAQSKLSSAKTASKTATKVRKSAQQTLRDRLKNARAANEAARGSKVPFFQRSGERNAFRLICSPEAALPFVTCVFRQSPYGQKPYRTCMDLEFLFGPGQDMLRTAIRESGKDLDELEDRVDEYGAPYARLWAELQNRGMEEGFKNQKSMRTSVLMNVWTKSDGVMLFEMSKGQFDDFYMLYDSGDEELDEPDLFDLHAGKEIIQMGNKQDGKKRRYSSPKLGKVVDTGLEGKDLLDLTKIVRSRILSWDDSVRFMFNVHGSFCTSAELSLEDFGVEPSDDEE